MRVAIFHSSGNVREVNGLIFARLAQAQQGMTCALQMVQTDRHEAMVQTDRHGTDGPPNGTDGPPWYRRTAKWYRRTAMRPSGQPGAPFMELPRSVGRRVYCRRQVPLIENPSSMYVPAVFMNDL